MAARLAGSMPNPNSACTHQERGYQRRDPKGAEQRVSAGEGEGKEERNARHQRVQRPREEKRKRLEEDGKTEKRG